MVTKGDLVRGALEELMIVGAITSATPEDTSLALRRLDPMMSGWSDAGIHIGYKLAESFDDLDPNDDSGLTLTSYEAVIKNLACTLCPAYGKMAPPDLKSGAKSAKDNLYDVELIPMQSNPYMPMGSGNSYYGKRAAFQQPDEPITVERDGNLNDLTI
ncbi:MAG: hypothetical protein GY782_03580 [Gammaproteobacteria bacterium]|nr:hypothetical protein [Gammaproteobacteria bacterium]